MTLRFSYVEAHPHRSFVSLPGRLGRPRPVLPVAILGPAGKSWTIDALLDSGADDTVFSEDVALLVGMDLSRSRIGSGTVVGMGVVALRYVQATLRVANNHEHREWLAWVAFTRAKLRYPILGFAGFLQFFTATFYGDRRETELTVNSEYCGT